MKHGLQVLDDYQKYGYVVGAFGGSPLSPRGGGHRWATLATETQDI